MDLQTLRVKYRARILEIAEECMAENVRVFGSVARGDEHPDSDVDFLVHMKPRSGFGIGGLYWRLEELLGCKVSIVHDTSIHQAMQHQVLNETVRL